jgi:hypothetical protein
MTPGTLYETDVEIWPTSVVVPKDFSLALTVQGKDWELPGAQGMCCAAPVRSSMPTAIGRSMAAPTRSRRGRGRRRTCCCRGFRRGDRGGGVAAKASVRSSILAQILKHRLRGADKKSRNTVPLNFLTHESTSILTLISAHAT